MLKMIKYLFLFFLLSVSVASHCLAESNILFSLQRHTYVEGSKRISVGLRNGEKEPYLVQSGMARLDINSGVNQLEGDNTDIPFLITPPLHKFLPDSYYEWYVIFSGAENILPKDKESVYLAKFLFIPASQKGKANDTDMSVMRSFVFKIYYRPKELASLKIKDVQDKISFSYNGGTLLVKNNSPIYITFDSLRVNSVKINDSELFKPVPPFSEQKFILNENISENNKVEWNILDEYAFPLDKNTSKATLI